MAKIKFRRDTASAWTQANPTLAQGEPGFEHDTGLLKIGDGATPWVNLDYASGGGDSLTDDQAVTVTVGNTDYWAIVNRANNDDDGVQSSAVAYDSQGNLVMLHITDVNDNALDPAPDKLIISKFSPTATLLWQKQIQEKADSSTAHDVCIDSNDNIIVIFNQDDAVDLGDYVNIIKFDSDGNEIWKKLYSSSILSTRTYDAFDLVDNTVGSGTFEGNAVQVISATNVPDRQTTTWTLEESSNAGATWTTTATIVGFGYDSNLDRYYYYVSAEEPPVTLAFETKDYRLTTQSVNTFMEAAGAVTDGTHIYVTGAWNANDSDLDNETTFILKVSGTDGTVAWAESIRFEEGAPDEAYGMEIDAAGNLILVGVARYPDGNGPNAAYVSKYSGVDGSHIWSRVLFDFNEDASYSGGDITVDSQNNIFVSINAIQVIASEEIPVATIAYIVKLNSSGTIQWARRAGPGPCASVATGIDTDSLGNVYLSALTTAQKNPTRDTNNFNEGDITDTRDVLAIAKYSTSGAVLWQRYIETDSYRFVQSTDQGTIDVGDFDHDRNHGRYLSLSNDGKIAVQVTVRKRDLDNDVIDSNYWESITFQIDQDGREMTIGSSDEKFSVKASRIPGKFVTLPEVLAGQTYSPTITNLVSVLDITTPTITYAEAELAQYTIKSAPYEYVFGNNGTLTIPNDGDVRLTQTQIGWFSIFGPANNSNDDVWIRANCVDPDTGDVYVVGQEDDNNRGFVARYNSQGEILWSIRLNDNDDGNDTRCNAVKIHPVTGNLVVLVEYYGNEDAALLLQIDPDTAQVVNELGFQDLGLDAGVSAYDFDFLDTGDSTDTVVVVGRKYDERKTYSVTPQTGSTTDILVFNRSDIAGDQYTNDWQISGTDLVGYNNITAFNYYSGLTGTVRQGSGANFDITTDGSGGYSVVIGTSGGINYLEGHKIKVLGTSLGGDTPANDAIITVTGATSGVISNASISGTSYGSAGYPARTGTNYQTGSGLEFSFSGPVTGTDYSYWEDHQITAGGTNYADGDIVTISGALLGGTTPANDLIATLAVTEGGVTGFNAMSGTSQNTTYRVLISGSTVDFGGVGSWNLSYDLGGEAFVWTPSWNKVVGSLNPSQYTSERYFSVAVGSDNSVYAVGEIYTDDSTSNYNAVVSKFNNLGVHQWSRALNTGPNGASAKCVAVRGTTVVVSSYNDNNGETVITKLDTTGNIKWQRQTDSGDDSAVAIDTNGDIYAVMEADFENKYESVIKVIRFASNGEPIWRKFFGTLTSFPFGGTREYFKNGRNITLDAEHFYVSGYTTAFDDDYESGFLVKLPKSGDCDGYYGGWTIQSDAYDVDKVIGSEANAFTPNIGTGNFESWEPEFETDWWDPSDDDYYQTLQPVVDRDGGAIEFADGTRQTTSAQQIPQIPITNGADHRLCLDDMGKHIYVTSSDTRISVPYHYDNPLPIGFTVVIINNSGGNVSIDADGSDLDIRVPGVDIGTYWDLASPGMATLIKVTESLWFMTGNVTLDN
jgi:hypothetical protein